MTIDIRKQDYTIWLHEKQGKGQPNQSEGDDKPTGTELTPPESKPVTASVQDILALQNQGVIRMVSHTYPEIIPEGYTTFTVGDADVGVRNNGSEGFWVSITQNNPDGNDQIINKISRIIRNQIDIPTTVELTGDDTGISFDPGVNGEIDEDVAQGGTGDCWLVSGILALNSTEAGKQIIKNSIKVNEDGSVTVTFKGLGVSYTITADEIKKYDTDNIKYDAYSNGDNDLLVLELAVEKLRIDIENGVVTLDPNLPEEYYYTSYYYEYNKQGTPGAAITGGLEEQLIYYMTGVVSNTIYANDGMESDSDETNLEALATGLSKEDVFKMLQEAYESGNTCITFGIYGGPGVEGSCHQAKITDGRTLTYDFGTLESWGGHALTITNLTSNTVTFVDPNKPSVEYTMTWEEFAKFGIGCITSADLSGLDNEPSPNPIDPVAPPEPTLPRPHSKIYTLSDLKDIPQSIIDRYFEAFGFMADGTPEEWLLKSPYTEFSITSSQKDEEGNIQELTISVKSLDENGNEVINNMQFFSKEYLNSYLGGFDWMLLEQLRKDSDKYFDYDEQSGLYMLKEGKNLEDLKSKMQNPIKPRKYDPADPIFWSVAINNDTNETLYPATPVKSCLSQGIINTFFVPEVNESGEVAFYKLKSPYTDFNLLSNTETEKTYQFSYVSHGYRYITTVTIDETDGSYRITNSKEEVPPQKEGLTLGDFLNN